MNKLVIIVCLFFVGCSDSKEIKSNEVKIGAYSRSSGEFGVYDRKSLATKISVMSNIDNHSIRVEVKYLEKTGWVEGGEWDIEYFQQLTNSYLEKRIQDGLFD